MIEKTKKLLKYIEVLVDRGYSPYQIRDNLHQMIKISEKAVHSEELFNFIITDSFKNE